MRSRASSSALLNAKSLFPSVSRCLCVLVLHRRDVHSPQVASSTGQPRLLVNDRYQNEAPEQLIPVLVHESMHDGVDNSYEEEIIASLLDSLTYAEVLTIDPAAANTGTELAAYNNVQLFALTSPRPAETAIW